ncbi:MAG TPA: hypothetical protein VI032_02620 [Burkholderiaceae bacterium]
MMLAWFDARAAGQFGADLAGWYTSQLPREAASLSEKKFAARTESAMKQMARRVDEFKLRQTLNVYKRAKLANAFKWALRDAGYNTAYIDQLTEWLVARL